MAAVLDSGGVDTGGPRAEPWVPARRNAQEAGESRRVRDLNAKEGLEGGHVLWSGECGAED